MSYKKVKDYRKRRKLAIVSSFGGKCSICGYDRCCEVLEFHHLDPSIKEFTISTNLNVAAEKIVDELGKCIILCSNCHREVHSGFIESPTITTFDKQLFLENTALTIIPDKTCTCGKILKRNGSKKYCSVTCAGVGRSSFDIDKETLSKLWDEHHNIKKIAEIIGMSDSALAKKLKKFGLYVRKKKYNETKI